MHSQIAISSKHLSKSRIETDMQFLLYESGQTVHLIYDERLTRRDNIGLNCFQILV